MNLEIENKIWDGVYPENLVRLVKYHAEYGGGSVNPREQDILNSYYRYSSSKNENEKRWNFASIINACVALNSIERWNKD